MVNMLTVSELLEELVNLVRQKAVDGSTETNIARVRYSPPNDRGLSTRPRARVALDRIGETYDTQ